MTQNDPKNCSPGSTRRRRRPAGEMPIHTLLRACRAYGWEPQTMRRTIGPAGVAGDGTVARTLDVRLARLMALIGTRPTELMHLPEGWAETAFRPMSFRHRAVTLPVVKLAGGEHRKRNRKGGR